VVLALVLRITDFAFGFGFENAGVGPISSLNAGFLQVGENWKMSGNLCCQGNVRKKY